MSHVFASKYSEGDTRVAFARTDLEDAAETLGIKLPKNLGDVVYTVRYRASMPADVVAKVPSGKHWVLRGKGRGKYEFAAVSLTHVVPTPGLTVTKVPDATPEILLKNRLGDEQALLAIMRYNRLIDIFLGITAYSLQNHLRTTASDIGQVEIDELYVGLDRNGAQYVVPVQAKGGDDHIGIVQAEQDLAVCVDKFSNLVARPVAAQFMADDVIALFELTVQDDEIRIVAEKHYKLVSRDKIDDVDLAAYRKVSGV